MGEKQLYAITLKYSEEGEKCNESTYMFLSDSALFTEDAINEAFNQLNSVVLDDGMVLDSYSITIVCNDLDSKVLEALDLPLVNLFRQ